MSEKIITINNPISKAIASKLASSFLSKKLDGKVGVNIENLEAWVGEDTAKVSLAVDLKLPKSYLDDLINQSIFGGK